MIVTPVVQVVLLLVALHPVPYVAVAADGSVPGVNLVHSAVEQEPNLSLAASWAATLLSGATVADPFLSGVDKEVAAGLLVMILMLPLPAVPSSHSRVPVSSWILDLA